MKKRGQVWIETVIYTLIGLAIIGLILLVVTPEVNKYKDKIVIGQTIDLMNQIDSKIDEVKWVAGNSRPLEIGIKKGIMKIDGVNDELVYELDDSRVIYSQPNQEVNVSKVSVLTETNGKTKVILRIRYSNIDIRYQDESEIYILQPAPQPYNLAVKNTGTANGKTVIDFT